MGVFLGVEADVKVDGKDEGDNGYQGWMKVLDVELPDMEDREGKNEILLGLTAATGGLCQGVSTSTFAFSFLLPFLLSSLLSARQRLYVFTSATS